MKRWTESTFTNFFRRGVRKGVVLLLWSVPSGPCYKSTWKIYSGAVLRGKLESQVLLSFLHKLQLPDVGPTCERIVDEQGDESGPGRTLRGCFPQVRHPSSVPPLAATLQTPAGAPNLDISAEVGGLLTSCHCAVLPGGL